MDLREKYKDILVEIFYTKDVESTHCYISICCKVFRYMGYLMIKTKEGGKRI